MNKNNVIDQFRAAMATAARRRYPESAIIVAADNDPSGESQAAARKTALAVGGQYIWPSDV